MTKEQISQYDSQNMYDILVNFPKQIKDAIKIGEKSPTFNNPLTSKNFVVLGMGGSAIGGDLVKSFVSTLPDCKDVYMFINRNYTIDFPITEDTNIIVSSYSGNTEETLAAYQEAKEKTKNIICITTGGKLEELAKKDKFPVIKIPGGMQPRCAIAYSFFSVLYILINANVFSKNTLEIIDKSIDDTQKISNNLVDEYKTYKDDLLPAIFTEIAYFSIPVFYASSDRLKPIAIRIQNQIHENSKHIAFANALPEMNHNELNSWKYPKIIKEILFIFFISDEEDDERTKLRTKATKRILNKYLPENVLDIEGIGNTFLTRMFSLIIFGDWASFYLAIKEKSDPTRIPAISKLKEILSKNN